MIYRSKSVKYVINKVFRDLGNTVSQHTDVLTDMIEWAGEALEGIGATAPLEDKPALLTIKDNRALLPCDLYLIKQVCYLGSPLKYGSQTFNYSQHCDNCINEIAPATCLYSYTVNPNYLNTDLPDGEQVEIFYQAFPTDEQGFPLVPDDFSYMEAIFWYIVYKLMMRGFEHPNRQVTFEFAYAQWLKYCSQAENEAKMFDIPQFDSFKNQWVRLAPNINPGDDFFRTANVQEQLYRGNHRRYSI